MHNEKGLFNSPGRAMFELNDVQIDIYFTHEIIIKTKVFWCVHRKYKQINSLKFTSVLLEIWFDL